MNPIGILGFCSLLLCFSCTNSSKIQAISPVAAASLQRHGFAIIVDIRGGEDSVSTPLGAVSMSWKQIKTKSETWKNFIRTTDSKKKIIFCCAGLQTRELISEFESTDHTFLYFNTVEEWEISGQSVRSISGEVSHE